jgi:hypothetical protein
VTKGLKFFAALAYGFDMAEQSSPNLVRELISTPEPPSLGPGPRPNVRPQATLSNQIDDALNTITLTGTYAELVRATVLLWHDYFDAAHAIAQEIESRDGSYVHAILHRREPDYENAKYWFRRVGQHPCFARLTSRAGMVLQSADNSNLKSKLIRRGEWDAFGFVDACEGAARASDDLQAGLLREIQRAEFEVLLEYLTAGK